MRYERGFGVGVRHGGHRRGARACGGSRAQRAARCDYRGSAWSGGARGSRAGAIGRGFEWSGPADQAYHHQPEPGRRAQGWAGIRPPGRAGHACGLRLHAGGVCPRRWRGGRSVARGSHQTHAGHAVGSRDRRPGGGEASHHAGRGAGGGHRGGHHACGCSAVSGRSGKRCQRQRGEGASGRARRAVASGTRRRAGCDGGDTRSERRRGSPPGQAGARDRSRGWAPPTHGGFAWRGQDDAGETSRGHTAAADAGGGVGGHPHLERRRAAAGARTV